MMDQSCSDLDPILRWAIKLAGKAGKLLLEFPRNRINTVHKGEIDLLTDADLECEQLILSAIHESFPYHSILSEEKGSNNTKSNFCWIVDPLDGTTNYSRGLPMYCVSIALSYKNEILLGVIHAPELGHLYYASKGEGAYDNHQKMRVSSVSDLSTSFLVTGFPYTMHQSDIDNIDLFRLFSKQCLAVRRIGSAALDLCYVAKGVFDAYWELKLHPWDFAAGSLIVTEAGGMISNMSGKELEPYSPSSVLACNPYIQKIMLEKIQEQNASKQ
jgi:myo-inositol-1(or 4)-monophosphatase